MISPEDISELTLPPGGDLAARTVYYRLGRLTMGSARRYLGLKIGLQDNPDKTTRLMPEIAVIDTCLKASPDLINYIPKFTFPLRIQGGGILSVLTEDISKGGSIPLEPCHASETLKELVLMPFRESGIDANRLWAFEEEDMSLAVTDGTGGECAIDFYPPPVELCFFRELPHFVNAQERMFQLLEDQTFGSTIPPESLLAQGILSRA